MDTGRCVLIQFDQTIHIPSLINSLKYWRNLWRCTSHTHTPVKRCYREFLVLLVHHCLIVEHHPYQSFHVFPKSVVFIQKSVQVHNSGS